jgi:hypothetical protein
MYIKKNTQMAASMPIPASEGVSGVVTPGRQAANPAEKIRCPGRKPLPQAELRRGHYRPATRRTTAFLIIIPVFSETRAFGSRILFIASETIHGRLFFSSAFPHSNTI